MKADDVSIIGVCGAGTMGAGIAQQAAVSGYTVRVLDVNDAAWERGLGIISGGLGKMLAKEKITQAEHDAILGRLSYSTDAASFADVDFVIEAVFEDIEVKRELFARLETVCRPEVVFATNTSSISITAIAAASRPAGPRGGHALLQPRAGDEAGRGDPGAADRAPKPWNSSPSSPRSWARPRPPARTRPASSSTASSSR